MIELLIAAALTIQSGARQFAWDFPDAALTIESVENGKPVSGVVSHFRLQIDAQSAVDVGLPVVGTIPNGKTYAVNVPALPAGTHVAKVFSCASIHWTDDPAAGSSTQCGEASELTFTVASQAPAQTVTVAPTQAIQGQALSVSWTCSSSCAANDWLGMFPKGATGSGGDIQWPGSYTQGAASGSYSSFKAPNAIGAYEIRYCKHTAASPNGYDCKVVAPFTVVASTLPVDCVVSAWGEWSAWAPISATQEQRTRTRSVVTPAANGGKPCPPLSETETRAIQPPPPVSKLECAYALTFTVTTQNNVATVSLPMITGSCK